MDTHTEEEGRKRITLAASCRAPTDTFAMHDKRSGSAVGPVEPAKKTRSVLVETIQLFPSGKDVEAILDVSGRNDKVEFAWSGHHQLTNAAADFTATFDTDAILQG
mmetsp:Transcript_22559/g.32413  ORF Transcript_22559/g.32413 Transcript_22559/m.32413 type:complete len:106 (-) Transcript_22559:903-1220(-)